VLPEGWTTQAGVPSAGLVMERPRPTGTDDTVPTAVPDAASGVAFKTGVEVDGAGLWGLSGCPGAGRAAHCAAHDGGDAA
jgi:hypothetical protein